MDTRQIIFTKYATAELLTTPIKAPEEKEVLVKMAYTAVSAGTERANITGNTHMPGMRDKVIENFFPRTLGYSGTGVVEAVGPGVTTLSVGDRVMSFWGYHREYNVLPERNVIRIDDFDVSMLDASFAFIGTFPLAAVRKTQIEIGESAMVVGLGILGLMAVALMRESGAIPVIAVDPNPARRALALSMGADEALDPGEPDHVERVKALTGGKGVNALIEVTGVGQALNQALRCMAPMGRAALLGCTRKPTEVDFYYDVHIPGVALYGAHTFARPEFESYPHHWTHRDDCLTLLKLMSAKRLNLGKLISEVHAPQEAPKVYERLVNDPAFPIGVAFDWSRLEK